MNEIKNIKLDTYPTKDIIDEHVNGNLTVIWRDYDKIIKFDPKMIYLTSVNSGEVKGPHIHTKRDSCFVCVQGKVIFIIKDKNGKYKEIESSEKNPILVNVPKNIASAHINVTSKKSSVLTIASIAWKPNDNEMKNISFDDYDWKKWELNNHNDQGD